VEDEARHEAGGGMDVFWESSFPQRARFWGLLFSKGLQIKLVIEFGELAFCGDGEELVSEIHEDAEVAGRMLGQGGLEVGSHERRIACGIQEMVEAGEEFLAGSIVEKEPATDAAADGKQSGVPEALREALVTAKDNAEELLGIEVFGAEDAELGEDGTEGFLRLVDEEDRTRGGRKDVLGPASAEGLEAGPAIVRGKGDGEEVAELPIEVGGLALGMLGDAAKDVWNALEVMGEEPEGDAFAGARVAGNQDEAAVLDAGTDAANKGIDGRRSVQSLDGYVGAEGVEFEAVQGL